MLAAYCKGFALYDHSIAAWCRSHLTTDKANILCILSEPGSESTVAIALTLGVIFLTIQRRWRSLAALLMIVPGGLMLNSLIKLAVHRHRPVVPSQFALWDGFSFPSGHTIGATLLYGAMCLAIYRAFRAWHIRALSGAGASLVVVAVGFSRVALVAHYLSDVLAAIVVGLAWMALCLATLRLARVIRQRFSRIRLARLVVQADGSPIASLSS